MLDELYDTMEDDELRLLEIENLIEQEAKAMKTWSNHTEGKVGSHDRHCHECNTPCPEHNIVGCATCHTHQGECDYGGCLQPATTHVQDDWEKRHVCAKHAQFMIKHLNCKAAN